MRSSSRIGAMLSAAWKQHAHTARHEALLLSAMPGAKQTLSLATWLNKRPRCDHGLNSENGVQNCWMSTDSIAQAKQHKAWCEAQAQAPHGLAQRIGGAMQQQARCAHMLAYPGAPREAVLAHSVPQRGQVFQAKKISG
ncbi:hypothetical protein HAX54_007630 [Datura stramonium]|uniref:Uncharacterized protein n=1 Tax=Datura stramonium TaxID=4076 RepID=A0ABS8TDQ0_DATST|nr:hypothetical protein [Datura stramonium]